MINMPHIQSQTGSMETICFTPVEVFPKNNIVKTFLHSLDAVNVEGHTTLPMHAMKEAIIGRKVSSHERFLVAGF
jgi:hypothetical protein